MTVVGWLGVGGFAAEEPAAPKPFDLRTEAARQATVQWLRQSSVRARESAAALARARGWPIRGELPDGGVFELRRVVGGQPRYLVTGNADAAISTAADRVRNTTPYLVNGEGYAVGLWDGGAVRSTHQEFGARVSIEDGGTLHWHATHVAGTIGAAGIAPAAQGMAPDVRIASYDWTDDLSEVAALAATAPGQADRIPLSNHSYGYLTGWEDGDWSGHTGPHYWGVAGEREDRHFGQYGAEAASWDQLHCGAPYYLAFKAAGNDRNDPAPASDTRYYYYDEVLGDWRWKRYDPDTDPYADGWDQGGYDTMEEVACAKNLVAVGAVNDAVAGGVRALAFGTMSAFSSWGPTDDGRIKPDVVANGVDLYSCYSTADDAYATAGGTSMATPNATGSAVLLVEYFGDLFPGEAMRASTLKGLILHTADDLGEAGPDYAYGWGLMNTEAAARHIQAHAAAPSNRHLYEGRLTSDHPDESFSFDWDGADPIRATVCWTDPAGTEQTGLDDRTPALVNDLDLRITGPDEALHYPYQLDVNNAAAPATTGDNTVDNVEQVFIAAPTTGTYTLTVSHKGALSGGEQDYSLILSGQGFPEIAVSVDGTELSTGQPAVVDFGSVTKGGTGPTRVFTVENRGTAPLTLHPPSLPTGYALIESLEASLAPDASDTFTVQLDTAEVGTKDGAISLGNNDGDENPFAFPVTGVVEPTAPTAVAVLLFRAIPVAADQVTLRWTTGVEFDLLGFYVEQQAADGSWTQLNHGLVPVLGSGQSADYALEGLESLGAATDRYRLIGVDSRGGNRVLAETAAAFPLRLTVQREGEELVFHLQGRPHTRPVLESTSDLAPATWRTLETVPLDAAGTGGVQIPFRGSDSRCYYRLRRE